jgi:CheY-like chemotaxis protein
MKKKLKIFLIEDDCDDIELLKEAFDANNIDCEIEVVMEGDKAMSTLSQSNEPPDVIVMDLNLPKLHGREILSLVKASEKFSGIPVVVLTTSSFHDDVKFAYSMGARQFITKPNTIEGFNTTVQSIVSLV